MEAITPNAAGDPTIFSAAVLRDNRHIVWAWADVLLAKLPRNIVSLQHKVADARATIWGSTF